MPPLRATGRVQNMYSMTSADLEEQLSSRGFLVDATEDKHYLQARLALATLGIVMQRESVDPVLLEKVAGWCKMLVRDQLEELNKRNLDIEGNKWDHVEVFIRAELETTVEKLARLSVAPDPLPNIPPPGITVLQFLITSIYAEISRTNSTILLPNFHVEGLNDSDRAEAILKLLDSLPELHTFTQLKAALELKSQPADLLKFICATNGSNFVRATGDLRIKHMPECIRQLVLVKPCTTLQNRFEDCMSKVNPRKSMVLWHGTMMMYMRSILVNGFAPCSYDQRFGSGLFMGQNARTSYPYAFGEAGEYDGLYDSNSVNYGMRGWRSNPWENSIFKGYGVLLGCEVTGKGQLTPDDDDEYGAVHVVTDLGRVMVRYIFLCPKASYFTPDDEIQEFLEEGQELLNEEMESKFQLLHDRYFRPQQDRSSEQA